MDREVEIFEKVTHKIRAAIMDRWQKSESQTDTWDNFLTNRCTNV